MLRTGTDREDARVDVNVCRRDTGCFQTIYQADRRRDPVFETGRRRSRGEAQRDHLGVILSNQRQNRLESLGIVGDRIDHGLFAA